MPHLIIGHKLHYAEPRFHSEENRLVGTGLWGLSEHRYAALSYLTQLSLAPAYT